MSTTQASTAQSTEQLRVLCVDDEPRVLDGLENHLAMHYEVHLATSGAMALEQLESIGAFSVIVSDMRMPQMNGAEFLRRARHLQPDATRILLTGQADLESAVAAINEGRIYRFLSKPCPPEDLLGAVEHGVRLYQLTLAERELLQNTLNGAVAVLADVMSLTTPSAFARVGALKEYVNHICKSLGIVDSWQYELAATLCRLGCITLPPSTLDKLYAGQELDRHEQAMFDAQSEVGQRLLDKIPRVGAVSQMIGLQRNPPRWSGSLPDTDAERIALGSNLLAVALAVDELVIGGTTPTAAVQSLLRSQTTVDRELLQRLRDFKERTTLGGVRALPLSELRSFMVLEQDVVSSSGNVLVKQGRELNGPLLERLRHFAAGVGVAEPIRVRIPGRD